MVAGRGLLVGQQRPGEARPPGAQRSAGRRRRGAAPRRGHRTGASSRPGRPLSATLDSLAAAAMTPDPLAPRGPAEPRAAPGDEPAPAAPSPASCHLRFRAFRGSGGAHPVRDLRRLRQLAWGWLRPDLHTSEQVLEALVLEQFLLCAPLGLQALARESGVRSCAALERLLLDPARPRHWSTVSLQGRTFLVRHGDAGRPGAPEDSAEDSAEGSAEGALDLSRKPAAGGALQAGPGGEAPPGTQGHSGRPPDVTPGPGGHLEGPGPPHSPEDSPTEVDAVTDPAGVQPPGPGGPEPTDGELHPGSAWRAPLGPRGAHPALPVDGGEDQRSPRRSTRRRQEDSPAPPGEPRRTAARCVGGSLALRQGGCDPAHSPDPRAPAVCTGGPSMPAPRPYACGDCPKTFRYRSQLAIHRRSHTGERPFCCPSCPKAFMQASDLRVHLRTHAGLRPFACEACGACFAHQSTLRCHRRTHTRARPFACQACGARFAHKGNLNVHLRTHSGARPYRCAACGAAFRQLGNLSRHRRTHPTQ
ncbi:Zinc finger and SCAN domain-containing protein 5B [Galemys pyrenaicus]|uniref:Zinc finger and SCAN domain-containing protein 5B n=1 Tax=Galemys pyrenaicus TaxID=202257 RepID=A0A8J6A1X7_GALPY|nr:Zinc finger and SCAN domain-containing protein 5B [Galemys pyrenaicus]